LDEYFLVALEAQEVELRKIFAYPSKSQSIKIWNAFEFLKVLASTPKVSHQNNNHVRKHLFNQFAAEQMAD